MRFRLLTATVFCLVLTASLNAAGMFSDVPLPKDLQLQGKMPAALTARAWSGRWRNPASPPGAGLNAIIIFERVAGKKAQIIYAYGDSPELQIKAGWARYEADLLTAGKKVRFSFTSKLGHVLDFEMAGAKLRGSMRGRNVKILMTPYQLGKK
ncbi:MAG: hypothetical protein PHU44_10270 [Syntrophales bacterium]|nr:hypothetical protein [Syntrophales bacterium]MDD5641735.1 hypothetical protein [Syntrophales bacterium]